MRPEEVPDELVAVGKLALVDAASAEAPHLPIQELAKAGSDNLDYTIQIILAAALPTAQAEAYARGRDDEWTFQKADLTNLTYAQLRALAAINPYEENK